ncbi:MAG TPA: thiolase family protein [Candidatus Lokiarchaeia archaeon]|nr:thiolase family protein [Candidatus Lokiarchaeia archaeon]
MPEPVNHYFINHVDPKREPVLVDYCRTAIGKKGGKVGRLRGDDLIIHCINSLIDRNAWLADDVKLVGDVVLGCQSQIGSCALDIGRTAVLGSKLHWSTPGVSLNQLCASGMHACHFGWNEIASGEKEVVITGGIELQNAYPIRSDMIVNGEKVPMNPKVWQNSSVSESIAKYGSMRFPDDPDVANLSNVTDQILSAELMGHVWNAPREELDAIALSSQQKANAAWDGRGAEIAPLEVPKVTEEGELILDVNHEMIPGETEIADRDEAVRPNTSLEILSQLKPIALPEKGLLTAGNSCPTSDGAAAALWMTRGMAEDLGLRIRATLVGFMDIGSDPVLRLTGPIDVTPALMKRYETSLDDMDFLEFNEAFSTVIYACCQELGLDYHDPRFNSWGGAIAIGHPTGMTGCRFIGTLTHQLEASQKSYGFATLCVGLGHGIACIVKREGA